MFLLWNDSEKIAEGLELPKTTVDKILAKTEVINYIREVQTNEIIVYQKLKKAQAGKEILDKVLIGIKKIADEVDATKWNKNHVELFKFLYHDLVKEEANAIKTIVNNINIQNNNYQKEGASEAEAMDILIGSLPMSKQEEFWMEVFKLAQKFYDDQKRSVIIQ